MDPKDDITDPQDDDTPQDDASDDGSDAGDDVVDGDAGADAGAADDGEVEITLGQADPAAEETPPRAAPDWLKDLRHSNREKDRIIRDLEKKLASSAPPGPQAVVVGAKPKLEDFNWDAEKFETELEAWHNRKREADEQQRTKAQAEEQQRALWQSRMDAVTKAASGLKVADAEDALMAFEGTFSPLQQGIIVGGPDDPKVSAQLRYALGKNPKLARELAAITDPVKFTMRLSKLEDQLKVTPRKSAPAPDTRVGSSVAGATAVDSALTRLQAEADKTGDRSKVAKYLRDKQRAKQAA